MKAIKMVNIALVTGRGSMGTILGTDERMALRLMQLLNAETEEDISIYEVIDADLEDDDWYKE